ncbi:MAG: hypothetical protein KatS3mg116_2099 [Elioraea sp.]|nr:MAG: hypothetical protein KatS3mg116_2099 [Elioraea sp.]
MTPRRRCAGMARPGRETGVVPAAVIRYPLHVRHRECTQGDRA